MTDRNKMRKEKTEQPPRKREKTSSAREQLGQDSYRKKLLAKEEESE